MGSNYFGEENMRNGRGSSSSSRKGKKSNNSEKPKQPQRGLGVAQLEKIRLHAQLASNYPPSTIFNQELDVRVQAAYSTLPSSSFSSSACYAFQPNVMPGLNHDQYERTNIRTTTPSWVSGADIFEAQRYAQQEMNINPLHVEDSLPKTIKKPWSDLMGSSSQNYDPSDTQELDLELKLSL